jgi:transcriptional regulator with XRE-family HTH domain
MPALPLTQEQLDDAARLKQLFAVWQRAQRDAGLPSSQEAISEQLGFNQSSLSQYLNGRIPLNIDAATKFANLIGKPVTEFSAALAGQIGRYAGPAEPVDSSAMLRRASQVSLDEPDPSGLISVPMVTMRVEAGVPGFEADLEFEDGGVIQIPREAVESENWTPRPEHDPGVCRRRHHRPQCRRSQARVGRGVRRELRRQARGQANGLRAPSVVHAVVQPCLRSEAVPHAGFRRHWQGRLSTWSSRVWADEVNRRFAVADWLGTFVAVEVDPVEFDGPGVDDLLGRIGKHFAGMNVAMITPDWESPTGIRVRGLHAPADVLASPDLIWRELHLPEDPDLPF